MASAGARSRRTSTQKRSVTALSPASPFATASPSQAGLLDIPFAAGRHSRGEVMVARDAEGKVRYLDPRPPD
jgi:hypothetical protein